MNPPERRTIFNGRVIDLSIDTVTLPNGHTTELEIVAHPGGAAAVAVDEQGQVCLLEQYRHATGGWLTELPAGLIEAGESPLVTARRELEEEAGLQALEWTSLGWIWSSPGVFTERIHLFLARQLRPVGHARQVDEVIRERWVALEQAAGSAVDGQFTDSKTVIGLLRAASLLQRP